MIYCLSYLFPILSLLQNIVASLVFTIIFVDSGISLENFEISASFLKYYWFEIALSKHRKEAVVMGKRNSANHCMMLTLIRIV